MQAQLASVFQSVMADAFCELPQVIQQVHRLDGRKILRGQCTVERGSHFLVPLLAVFASLPPARKNVPLQVAMEPCNDRATNCETWTRDFDGHIMRSVLRAHRGLLAERLGAVTLLFELAVTEQRLIWAVRGARFLGLPLPAKWFANSTASEQIIEGRYSFDVRASLPLVGLLVHYHGWLSEHA